MKLSNLQKKLEKSEQYLPAEDTFFLADQLKGLSGNSALDIGCGSGYLTDVLKSTFELVVGTDISFNTLLEQNYKTQNAICCNSADALNQKFDLIICNLPYLATDEIIDVATDGGKDGLEIPIGNHNFGITSFISKRKISFCNILPIRLHGIDRFCKISKF